MVYGTHNKSLASVRTADTVAIERMAGTMDVAQRIRTGSYRTMGSTSTADTHPDFWEPHSGEIEEYNSSPIEMTHTEPSPTLSRSQHPDPEGSSPLELPTSEDNNHRRKPEGAVGARIQAYERQLSQDEERPSARQLEELARKKNVSVNYGLVQRPSLYVANPDHRTNPSGGS